MSLTFAIVIPARYKSSRFPGKPLTEICGKPMIQRVWEQCCKVANHNDVYVATDDERIKEAAEKFGANVVMTSESCLTGTDRIAEANKELKRDFIVNVQGDEPVINPNDILKIIDEYKKAPGLIINAFCKITDDEDAFSFTLPKVVFSTSNRLLYMSRAAIPLTKYGVNNFAYKQVCIYAFSREHLDFFLEQNVKSPMEEQEDIEILRFLEHDIEVKMVEVESGSIAVDVPEDVVRVEEYINNRK